MNKFSLFAFVSFLASASAHGATASFEQDVNGALTQSAQTAQSQNLAATHALTISCANIPDATRLPVHLKFYTRFGAHAGKVLPADDTAMKLNDNAGAWVKDGAWHFSATSCDSMDYFFDFSLSDLARTALPARSRALKGHARSEARGYAYFDGPIDCVASW